MATPVGPPPIPDTVIFGPHTYAGGDRPVVDRQTFHVTDPTGTYVMRVMSRGVTIAVIAVNGRVVLRPADLRNGNRDDEALVARVDIPIDVRLGNNQIVTAFPGRRGSLLAIDIVRTAPPP
jgi:hypothetical protein